MNKSWLSAFVGPALVFALNTSAAPPGPTAGQTAGAPQPIKVGIRRLTETQYRHTIAEAFGPETKIEARFEPEKREDGLLAIGSSQASLTSSGFEQYFALASSISDQALSAKQRETLLGASQPTLPRRTMRARVASLRNTASDCFVAR